MISESESQDRTELLQKVIDQAYWMIEVGDRIGALRVLSQYARPSDQKDHWLNKKDHT